MLDNTEPTGNTSTDPDNNTSSDGASAAPAKAARKAPAKRAPRKSAAKKAAPALAGPADPLTQPSGTQPADTQPADGAPVASLPVEPAAADAAVPAKKASRPRKAAAKKATKAAPADPILDPNPPAAVESAPAEAAPADEANAADATVSAPAAPKKAPRKRASKKAAPAAAVPADTHVADAESPAPDQAAAPALVAPAVLFQAPVETPPAPRRRRSTRSAKAQPGDQSEQNELVIEQAVADAAEQAGLLDRRSAAEKPTDTDGTALEDADDAEDNEQDADQDRDGAADGSRRRRRRGRRGRGSRGTDGGNDAESSDVADRGSDDPSGTVTDADEASTDDENDDEADHADEDAEAALSASARRRRRRRRSTGADGEPATTDDDPPNTVVHVRDGGSARGGSGSNRGGTADDDGVRGVKGSTRLEAKRQRRRDNRDSGRRRAPILTEAEFLARREAVSRVMAVRQTGDRTQIAVLEDDILVEHYVTRASASSAVGNVYLGRVQNVLPSMEAAFIDIGRGRNGVLYAGEVNWDMAGLEGKARSIENALSGGDTVLVQVTKDPIGHKGARLTSQISLPGRFVVYVPGGGMTGISRKLPDTERSRLKSILKKVVPDEAGVIVRTAAEGASEQDLISDVERLKAEWDAISAKVDKTRNSNDGPSMVHGEPDLAIRVVRDIFNDDFSKLIVAGSEIHQTLSEYVGDIAPELANRISLHTANTDLFRDLRVDEQLAKALDRKVWLPSGGSLVIDRTEAMSVVDVNTGKYTGSGGNLEQTVTRNNLEAAEEIVRQLRLRDIGGIVVIDFIDMVLESNRDLVLRRLTECLGRDRTKHQVAEVTSLGLVQMTRKRVGEGLLEAFSEPCQVCNGRGVIVHLDPVDKKQSNGNGSNGGGNNGSDAEPDRPARGKRTRKPKAEPAAAPAKPDAAELAAENDKRRAAASAIAAIAAATAHHDDDHHDDAAEPVGAGSAPADQPVTVQPTAATEPVDPAFTEYGEAVVTPPRPRRRRAASRPAGPPAAVESAAAE